MAVHAHPARPRMHRAVRAGAWTAALVAGVAWVLAVPSGPGAAAGASAGLTGDAGGLPLFSGTDPFSPGVTRAACIALGAEGMSADDEVRFGAEAVTGELAERLALDVSVGRGGRYGDCSGFVPERDVFRGTLSDLAAVPAAGLETGWRPRERPGASFRITARLTAAATPRGSTATATFVWGVPGSTTEPPPANPTPPPVPTPVPTRPPSPSPTPTSSPDPSRSPSLSPDPSRSPDASPSPDPSPSPAGTPGGVDGGGGAGLPERADPPPDLMLRRSVTDRALQALRAIVVAPQFALGPLVVAVLFLVTQHLIDLRDPKLAHASRTRREQTVAFRRHYRAPIEEDS